MKIITKPLADESKPSTSIRTTLYDLIEVINAEVGPEDERLVIATVVHLLNTGRIKFLGHSEANTCASLGDEDTDAFGCFIHG
jgi:hypothetical protein